MGSQSNSDNDSKKNQDTNKLHNTGEVSTTGNDAKVHTRPRRDSQGIIRRKALYVSSTMPLKSQIQSGSVSSNTFSDNVNFDSIGISSNNTVSGVYNYDEHWKENNHKLKNKFMSLDRHMNLSTYNNNNNNNNSNNIPQPYSTASLNRNRNSISFSPIQYQNQTSYPMGAAVPITISQTNANLNNTSICISPKQMTTSPKSYIVINQNSNNSFENSPVLSPTQQQDNNGIRRMSLNQQGSYQITNGNIFLQNTYQTSSSNNLIYGSPSMSNISPSSPKNQTVVYSVTHNYSTNTMQPTSPTSPGVRIQNHNHIPPSQRYSLPVIPSGYSIITPGYVTKSNTMNDIEKLNTNNPSLIKSPVFQTVPNRNINHHNTVSLSESGSVRSNGSFCGLSVNGREYRHSSVTTSPLDNNQNNSMNRKRNKSNSFSVAIPERKDSTYLASIGVNAISGTNSLSSSIPNNNNNGNINNNDSRNNSFRNYSMNLNSPLLPNSSFMSNSSYESSQNGSKNINIPNNNSIIPDCINDGIITPRSSSYSNSLRNGSQPIDIPCSIKSSSSSDSLNSSFSSYRGMNYVMSTSKAEAETLLSESHPQSPPHGYSQMDNDLENDHDLIFDLEHTTSIPRTNSNEKEIYEDYSTLFKNRKRSSRDRPLFDRELLDNETLNSSTAFSNLLDSYSNILNSFETNEGGEKDNHRDSILSIPSTTEDMEDSKIGTKSIGKTDINETEKSNSKVQRNPSTLLGLDVEVEKDLLKKRNTLKSKDRAVADEILRKMSISHAKSLKKTLSQQSESKNRSIKTVKNGSVDRENTLNRNDSNLSSNKSQLSPLDEATMCQEANEFHESSVVVAPIQVLNKDQGLFNSSPELYLSNEGKSDVDIGIGLIDKLYEECLKRIDSESDEENNKDIKENKDNNNHLSNSVPTVDRNNSIIDFDDELRNDILNSMLFASTPSLENIKSFLGGQSLIEEVSNDEKPSSNSNENITKYPSNNNKEIKTKDVTGHVEVTKLSNSLYQKEEQSLIPQPLSSNKPQSKKIVNATSVESCEPPSMNNDKSFTKVNRTVNTTKLSSHTIEPGLSAVKSSTIMIAPQPQKRHPLPPIPLQRNENKNIKDESTEVLDNENKSREAIVIENKNKEVERKETKKAENKDHEGIIIENEKNKGKVKESDVKEVENKNNENKNKTKEVENKNNENKNKTKEVENKNNENENKTKEVENKNNENENKTKEVENKNNENENKTKEVENKNNENENKTKEVENKNNENENKTKEVENKKVENKETDKNEIDNTKDEFKSHEIKESKEISEENNQDMNGETINSRDSIKKIEVILKRNSDRGNEMILPQSISDINKENKDEKPFIPNKTEVKQLIDRGLSNSSKHNIDNTQFFWSSDVQNNTEVHPSEIFNRANSLPEKLLGTIPTRKKSFAESAYVITSDNDGQPVVDPKNYIRYRRSRVIWEHYNNSYLQHRLMSWSSNAIIRSKTIGSCHIKQQSSILVTKKKEDVPIRSLTTELKSKPVIKGPVTNYYQYYTPTIESLKEDNEMLTKVVNDVIKKKNIDIKTPELIEGIVGKYEDDDQVVPPSGNKSKIIPIKTSVSVGKKNDEEKLSPLSISVSIDDIEQMKVSTEPQSVTTEKIEKEKTNKNTIVEPVPQIQPIQPVQPVQPVQQIPLEEFEKEKLRPIVVPEEEEEKEKKVKQEIIIEVPEIKIDNKKEKKNEEDNVSLKKVQIQEENNEVQSALDIYGIQEGDIATDYQPRDSSLSFSKTIYEYTTDEDLEKIVEESHKAKRSGWAIWWSNYASQEDNERLKEQKQINENNNKNILKKIRHFGNKSKKNKKQKKKKQAKKEEVKSIKIPTTAASNLSKKILEQQELEEKQKTSSVELGTPVRKSSLIRRKMESKQGDKIISDLPVSKKQKKKEGKEKQKEKKKNKEKEKKEEQKKKQKEKHDKKKSKEEEDHNDEIPYTQTLTPSPLLSDTIINQSNNTNHLKKSKMDNIINIPNQQIKLHQSEEILSSSYSSISSFSSLSSLSSSTSALSILNEKMTNDVQPIQLPLSKDSMHSHEEIFRDSNSDFSDIASSPGSPLFSSVIKENLDAKEDYNNNEDILLSNNNVTLPEDFLLFNNNNTNEQREIFTEEDLLSKNQDSFSPIFNLSSPTLNYINPNSTDQTLQSIYSNNINNNNKIQGSNMISGYSYDDDKLNAISIDLQKRIEAVYQLQLQLQQQFEHINQQQEKQERILRERRVAKDSLLQEEMEVIKKENEWRQKCIQQQNLIRQKQMELQDKQRKLQMEQELLQQQQRQQQEIHRQEQQLQLQELQLSQLRLQLHLQEQIKQQLQRQQQIHPLGDSQSPYYKSGDPLASPKLNYSDLYSRDTSFDDEITEMFSGVKPNQYIDNMEDGQIVPEVNVDINELIGANYDSEDSFAKNSDSYYSDLDSNSSFVSSDYTNESNISSSDYSYTYNDHLHIYKPEDDLPYARFNPLVEKALYQLSWNKLSYTKRSLHQQVVIRNLMIYYFTLTMESHNSRRNSIQRPVPHLKGVGKKRSKSRLQN